MVGFPILNYVKYVRLKIRCQRVYCLIPCHSGNFLDQLYLENFLNQEELNKGVKLASGNTTLYQLFRSSVINIDWRRS